MSSSKETNSNLNIILESHKIKYKYTISNVLRLIHRKLLETKYFSFFRKIIEKIIGKKFFIMLVIV